jgi:hypothetical protein
MPVKSFQEKTVDEQSHLDDLFEQLNCGDLADTKACTEKCKFFRHFGRKQITRVGVNEGRCGLNGERVYAGCSICNQERKG